MIITMENDTLQMGRDFVSAVTGPYKSHGTVEVNHKLYKWLSTETVNPSQNALYALARKENKRVTGMTSQALEEGVK